MIKLVQGRDAIRIYIKGKLHAWICNDIVGVQSWIERGKSNYVIEYTFAGGASLICEYDNEKLWAAILDALDGVL